MPIIILSVIVILLTLRLVYITVKNVESNTVKVVLSITIVLTGVVVEIVGSGIIGLVYFVKNIGDAANTQKEENISKIKSRIPVVLSTGEKKESFSKDEIVKGNGVEISILNTKDIIVNSTLLEKKTICSIQLKLKNIHTEKQIISSSDFEMQESDGTILSSYSIADQTLQDYDFKPTEVQTDKEVIKKIAFDCKKAKKPTIFIYEGGQNIDYLFFAKKGDAKFIPIKYNLDF